MNINRCLPVIRATLPLKFPKPEAMMFNDRQSESTVYRTFGLFPANYSVISVIDHGNARAWTLLASYTGAFGQDLPPPPLSTPSILTHGLYSFDTWGWVGPILRQAGPWPVVIGTVPFITLRKSVLNTRTSRHGIFQL